MNRRDALGRVALLLGGTVIGAEVFLSGCYQSSGENIGGAGTNFSNDDVAFLDEVAETILPATDSPGPRRRRWVTS